MYFSLNTCICSTVAYHLFFLFFSIRYTRDTLGVYVCVYVVCMSHVYMYNMRRDEISMTFLSSFLCLPLRPSRRRSYVPWRILVYFLAVHDLMESLGFLYAISLPEWWSVTMIAVKVNSCYVILARMLNSIRRKVLVELIRCVDILDVTTKLHS